MHSSRSTEAGRPGILIGKLVGPSGFQPWAQCRMLGLVLLPAEDVVMEKIREGTNMFKRRWCCFRFT